MYNLLVGLVPLIVGITIIFLGFFLNPQQVINVSAKGKMVSNQSKYVKIQKKLYFVHGILNILVGVLLLLNILTLQICIYVYSIVIITNFIINFITSTKYIL